jgi:hypothetical protein
MLYLFLVDDVSIVNKHFWRRYRGKKVYSLDEKVSLIACMHLSHIMYREPKLSLLKQAYPCSLHFCLSYFRVMYELESSRKLHFRSRENLKEGKVNARVS